MEPGAIEDNGANKFHAQVNTARPASDYTARIIPCVEGVSVPLEDNLILWQR
jgi:glycogen phosphorylase